MSSSFENYSFFQICVLQFSLYSRKIFIKKCHHISEHTHGVRCVVRIEVWEIREGLLKDIIVNKIT